MYIVLFAEFMGRTGGYEEYRYNLIPFHEIKRYLPYLGQKSTLGVLAFTNIVGNVLIFIPFGFFVPVVLGNRVKLIKTVSLTLSFSATIEIVQLICMVGTCDIDDCLLNTIGGLIGYMGYYLYKLIHKKQTEMSGMEKE